MTEGLTAVVEVLRGPLHLSVELQVAAGETVAVLGPNGSGKTTLLHTIAGVVPATAGRIEIDGEVVDEPGAGAWLPPERRGVGVAFQDQRLFPQLSALDNVAYGLRARRRPRRAARAFAMRLLEGFAVAEVAARRPGALSGGQAQRVALARALATGARVLLLDEPLSALDATARPLVRERLSRHLGDHDGAAIVVTHDPVDAEALADRVVILEDGRAVQNGTLADIAAGPRTRFAADLVGINLYRGEAGPSGVALGGGVVLTATGAFPAGPVSVVIHPRAVALHRDRPQGSPRNVMSGTVVAADHANGVTRVRVEGAISVVAEVTTAAFLELGATRGDEVWLSVKATEVAVHPS